MYQPKVSVGELLDELTRRDRRYQALHLIKEGVENNKDVANVLNAVFQKHNLNADPLKILQDICSDEYVRLNAIREAVRGIEVDSEFVVSTAKEHGLELQERILDKPGSSNNTSNPSDL